MSIKNEYGREWLPLVEEFHSIQGEGFHTGKPAWFIRLGGCDIGCSWCDSPFSWDPELHEHVHVDDILRSAVSSGADSVVVTGGEPLMWDLTLLCSRLRDHNLRLYLETCGIYKFTGKWDWICLSPKKTSPPQINAFSLADELKVIIESTEDFAWAEECRMKVHEKCRLYLQPEWSRFKNIMPEIVGFVKNNRMWTISLQSHKFMNIP